MTIKTTPVVNGFVMENGNVTANGDHAAGTDGIPPASAHVNDTKQMEEVTIPLNNTTAYTPRKKLRVVTIGAGYSGLTLAYKLQHQYPEMKEIMEHTIYEARDDIGGTWLANTYPGVLCDVPSHIYAFPFDPNPDWSHFYSGGAEILEYMQKTVKKWALDRDVQLNTRVVGAYWQEDRSQWKLLVEHEDVVSEEYADILISGQGFLNVWKWPTIEGLHDFKGQLVHSAHWDHAYDYSHKRIAVIGNGSSGIQILPQMAKLDGTEVISFQRGPTWIVSHGLPARSSAKDGTRVYNPPYTEEQKKTFREDPAEHNKYRKSLINGMNKSFKLFVKGSKENLTTQQFAVDQMAEKLNHDPDLCEKLIPKWELGCRRLTPGEGYLESFTRPNVKLTQSPITKVTENGIYTTDGKFYEVDVIVCATGFDVSHCPLYPVIGRDGVSLADKWADEPESYISLACPSMPNYFIFTGPNALVGHGSLIESLGWGAEYMIKWIRKISSEDIASVAPKQHVVDEFVRYSDQIHKTLTWTGACRSWYKKNRVDGRVTATFAGSALVYRRLISELRTEDFEIMYRSQNRFRFLGNGFTEYEMDEEKDLAWYVEK